MRTLALLFFVGSVMAGLQATRANGGHYSLALVLAGIQGALGLAAGACAALDKE